MAFLSRGADRYPVRCQVLYSEGGNSHEQWTWSGVITCQTIQGSSIYLFTLDIMVNIVSFFEFLIIISLGQVFW